MLPAQMRKGLARAFGKFDEYQLAKYDRDGVVKLRDVLRLARPKPKELWRHDGPGRNDRRELAKTRPARAI
jgi:hypothetical protein